MLSEAFRRGGRWLLLGEQRKRIYYALNRAGLRLLGGRIRRGPAAGLRFAGGGMIGYVLGISEPLVQQVFVDHLHAGAVLYDVGAHAGFTTVLGCRLVGPTGQVHSFEPIPANVAVLRRNIEANGFANATVHQLALSDHDGVARMIDDKRTNRSKLADEGTLEVRTARLDSLELPHPTLVKIDVEAAETAVLAGMVGLLAAARPALVVEIHDEEEQPVREVLAAAGYESVLRLDDGGMLHLLAR